MIFHFDLAIMWPVLNSETGTQTEDFSTNK